jgi:glyoxylase I family protein
MKYDSITPKPREEGEHLGYRMMALEVEDMQQALGYLKGKGIEPVWGPITRPAYARAEIRDPDGNHIELRHWKS